MSNTYAKQQIAMQTDVPRTVVEALRKALAAAQQNHHIQALTEAKFAKSEGRHPFNSGHKYANWQQCPAGSCREALVAWKGSRRWMPMNPFRRY